MTNGKRIDKSTHVGDAELLGLSKMNWNATQLDGKLPITVRTADRIGSILKYLGEDEQPAPLYAFYI